MTRRYANGFTANGALTVNRVTENRTVEEYDREPTLWQTNNNGRPWRLSGTAVYELPFGPGKPFLRDAGVVSYIARGWQVGGAAEYQPGAVLQWNQNIFFTGDLSNIKKGSSRNRASARRHIRPDEELVQHRRGVRAGYG